MKNYFLILLCRFIQIARLEISSADPCADHGGNERNQKTKHNSDFKLSLGQNIKDKHLQGGYAGLERIWNESAQNSAEECSKQHASVGPITRWRPHRLVRHLEHLWN